MARHGRVTREWQIRAALDQGSEELAGGDAADVVLHEVPLAFQHHLVHPGDAKAIPEVCQARLDARGAQLCLDRNPGLVINPRISPQRAQRSQRIAKSHQVGGASGPTERTSEDFRASAGRSGSRAKRSGLGDCGLPKHRRDALGGSCVKARNVATFFAYRQKKSRIPMQIFKRNSEVRATRRWRA